MENKHGELIENAINDCGCKPFLVACYLTNSMHRYLQNEFFKIILYVIGFMAQNYEKGYYDGRNEYACKKAKQIFDSFLNNEELQYLHKQFEYEYENLNK